MPVKRVPYFCPGASHPYNPQPLTRLSTKLLALQPPTPHTTTVPQQIIDQYTHLPISRQRKSYLRRLAAGLCRTCKNQSVEGSQYCAKHRDLQRERTRTYASRKRYANFLSVNYTTPDDLI